MFLFYELGVYVFPLSFILGLDEERDGCAAEKSNQLHFMPNFPNQIFKQSVNQHFTCWESPRTAGWLAEAAFCTICAEYIHSKTMFSLNTENVM